MAEQSSFERSLTALSQYFVGDQSLQETLTRVVELAADAMPAATYVGITMLQDGQPRTSAFSDPDVPEIDQAQYDAGTGPCLDAFRNGEIYRITDTTADGPWLEFRKSCDLHGIHSTLSMPLVVADISYGALNMYASGRDAFGASELAQARAFSVPTAVVLANSNAYWNARQLHENLAAAMVHRAEIEQAKGIVMGAMRCTADQAFEQLVKQSQHENRKLREIAIEIVENTTRKR